MLRVFAPRLVVSFGSGAARTAAGTTAAGAAIAAAIGGASNAFGAVRFMSKYLSKAATKRLPLTSKRARKGYYKGNGATREGFFIKGGKYRLDRSKMLELMVPSLDGFKLKPYVAASVAKWPPESKRPIDGQAVLSPSS